MKDIHPSNSEKLGVSQASRPEETGSSETQSGCTEAVTVGLIVCFVTTHVYNSRVSAEQSFQLFKPVMLVSWLIKCTLPSNLIFNPNFRKKRDQRNFHCNHLVKSPGLAQVEVRPSQVRIRGAGRGHHPGRRNQRSSLG